MLNRPIQPLLAVLIPTLLAVSLSMVGCEDEVVDQLDRDPPEQGKSSPEQGKSTPRQDNSIPKVVPTTDPSKLDEQLRGPWRPKPDHRFVLALERIERVVSGNTKVDVEITRHAKGWQVTVDDQPIGELARVPTFTSLDALLLKFARSRLADADTDNIEAEELDDAPGRLPLDGCVEQVNDGSGVVEALTEAENTWADERNSAALADATCLWLALEVARLDELGLADDTSGRAWAMLTVLRAVHLPDDDGSDSDAAALFWRERALLASLLGYEAQALQLTDDHGASPSEDPVVNIARGALTAGDDDALSGVLTARVAFQRGIHGVPALPAVERGLPLRVAASEWAECNVGTCEKRLKKIAAVSGEWLATAFDARAADRPGVLLTQTTAIADQLEAGPDASLAGWHDLATWVRAISGSVINMELRRTVDMRAAPGLAKPMRRALKTMKDQRLMAYADIVTAAGNQEFDLDKAESWLELMQHSGPGAVVGVINDAHHVVKPASPSMHRLARLVLPHLDTRPAHRRVMLKLTHSALLDPGLAVEWREHLIAAAPRTWATITAADAAAAKDADALLALSEDETIRAADRATMLRDFADVVSIPAEDVKSRLLTLVDDSDLDTSVVQPAVAWLRTHDEDEAIVDILERQLAKSDIEPIEGAIAAASLASTWLELGDTDRAWDTIKPWVDTKQYSAMRMGAMALVAKGGVHRNQGLALASAAIERYPGQGTLIPVEALWRAGDYEEASKHFAKAEDRNRSAWVFADVFSDDHTKAKEAFKALQDHGIDPGSTSTLVSNLYRFGDHELVDSLGSLVPKHPLAAEAIASVYLVRAERSDPETALASLSGKLEGINQRARLLIGLQAHGLGADRVALTLLEPLLGHKSVQGRYIQLVYAAAAARAGDQEAISRIENSLEKAGPKGFYIRMTRMVLGQIPTKEAFDGVTAPKQICEGGWFAAVRAEIDGKNDEAVLWMRLSFETQARDNMEWSWSARALETQLRALTP